MALQAFARNMRAAPTDAEAPLWRQLRAHRFAGHKFKRQQPIGNYIVDFVCFEARLVVEVDGGQHNRSVADEARDEWLEARGFRVMRFWNNDVMGNLDGVLLTILNQLTPSPQPLPLAGGGASISSLPPAGGGWNGEFAAHAPRPWNGCPMQRAVRPARTEGEGE